MTGSQPCFILPCASRMSRARAAQDVEVWLWPLLLLCLRHDAPASSAKASCVCCATHLPPALARLGRGPGTRQPLHRSLLLANQAFVFMSPCPLAGLTLHETLDYPVSLLPQCSPPEPGSLQLILPATHGEVLPWADFSSGTNTILDRLDNSIRAYNKPNSSLVHSLQIQRAVAPSEIRTQLSHFMEPVNMAAAALNIAVECCIGGEGRGISHADMVLCPAGAHSNAESLSKHILGTVLVTPNFQLRRGERLEAALKDPDRKDAIESMIQQVCSTTAALNLLLCRGRKASDLVQMKRPRKQTVA